jgi:hypothetical protein
MKVKMKAFTILIMALVAVCFSTTDGIGKVIFVDTDATGSSNGTSWADAYTELQSALAEAQANDEIWVAEGTYKPTAGLDRTISFSMKNGVAIYGGFDPTDGDIDFADRDWENNITVLSGNIGNVASRADNSYHVFFHPVGTDLDGTAILDGFTISGGNANGSFPHSRGAGMVNEESSPTLSNCTFSGNSTNIGGGMFNNNSSPILTNCIMWGDIPN